jgi:hypothetical protein
MSQTTTQTTTQATQNTNETTQTTPPPFNKYHNSTIYKIKCLDSNVDEIYIGSTINLKIRKYLHKSNCYNVRRPHYNYNLYKKIRECDGWDNWSIEIIETYKATNKRDLEKRERHWIDILKPTINVVKPFVTYEEIRLRNKEYCIKYRERKRQEQITT